MYIYGCGGHARSICGVLKRLKYNNKIILVDLSAKKNEKIDGYMVIKKIPEKERFSFYAIGDNQKRKELFNKDNEVLINIISSTAIIEFNAVIKKGTFVGNFVNVGVEALIEENCIINTGAIIEHECKIGAHSHVAPGTRICGRSKVGEQCFLGAGTIVIDGISICHNVVIGAGSVVINNIVNPGVYVGNPARRIR